MLTASTSTSGIAGILPALKAVRLTSIPPLRFEAHGHVEGVPSSDRLPCRRDRARREDDVAVTSSKAKCAGLAFRRRPPPRARLQPPACDRPQIGVGAAAIALDQRKARPDAVSRASNWSVGEMDWSAAQDFMSKGSRKRKACSGPAPCLVEGERSPAGRPASVRRSPASLAVPGQGEARIPLLAARGEAHDLRPPFPAASRAEGHAGRKRDIVETGRSRS